MKITILKSIALICSLAFATEASLSQQDAMQIAAQEIKNITLSTNCGNWTSATEITNAFPVYIDGIAGISYYECKAMTNGVDAGYVLVNVNQTDIIIAESSPSGKTLNEQYSAIIGNSNFIVCRYSDVCSAAMDPNSKAILSTIGFANPNQNGLAKTTANVITSAISQFRSAAQQNLCNPNYPPSVLKQYYSDSAKTALGKVTGTTTDFVQLQNSLACGGTLDGIQTPSWNQYTKSDGCANGCGPVAWAIVYGYWKQFKGKDGLFPGLANLNNDYCVQNDIYSQNNVTYPKLSLQIYNCMDACASSMGTFETSNQSATLPANMWMGSFYAKNCGYDVSCNVAGSVNNDDIKSSISNDRPVIIGTTDNFWNQVVGAVTGIPDHYVVVEKYLRYNKDLLWGAISYPSSIRFYCNYGWGGIWKWVYSLDNGISVPGKCIQPVYCTINDYSNVQFYASSVNGKCPLQVTFTLVDNLGSNSNIWGGAIPCMLWDFGDGTTEPDEDMQASPNTTTFTHTYTHPGTFSVTLKASEYCWDTSPWPYIVSKANYIHAYKDISPIELLLLGN